MPIAIIEAKDNSHSSGDGMQQGLHRTELLDVPFVFSSNGAAFLDHNRTISAATVERELALDACPLPEALWRRYYTTRVPPVNTRRSQTEQLDQLYPRLTLALRAETRDALK